MLVKGLEAGQGIGELVVMVVVVVVAKYQEQP